MVALHWGAVAENLSEAVRRRPWPTANKKPIVILRVCPEENLYVYLKDYIDLARYLGDPEATANAFDEDGYYKSDDLAHQVGNEYILDGRRIDCKL